MGGNILSICDITNVNFPVLNDGNTYSVQMGTGNERLLRRNDLQLRQANYDWSRVTLWQLMVTETLTALSYGISFWILEAPRDVRGYSLMVAIILIGLLTYLIILLSLLTSLVTARVQSEGTNRREDHESDFDDEYDDDYDAGSLYVGPYLALKQACDE